MGATSDELETFHLQIGYPGWERVDDIFTWFEERKDEYWIVLNECAVTPAIADILQSVGALRSTHS